MSENVASTPQLLEAAVRALIEGQLAQARTALQHIDTTGLLRQRRALQDAIRQTPHPKPTPGNLKRRPYVGSMEKLRIFQRDAFTCRYVHCQRPTIALEVLYLLSAAVPDLIPYESNNWPDVAKHIVYWTYSASLEHFVAHSAGGASDASNLFTACAQCNYGKNRYSSEELGWQITATPAQSGWDGLHSYLPELDAAVRRLTAKAPLAISHRIADRSELELPDPADLRPGMLVRAMLPGHSAKWRRYRIDTVSRNDLEIREMWQRDRDRSWAISPRTRHIDLDQLGVLELMGAAPEPV